MKNVNLKRIEKQLFHGTGPLYDSCELNEEESREALIIIGMALRVIMQNNRDKTKKFRR